MVAMHREAFSWVALLGGCKKSMLQGAAQLVFQELVFFRVSRPRQHVRGRPKTRGDPPFFALVAVFFTIAIPYMECLPNTNGKHQQRRYKPAAFPGNFFVSR